MVKNKTSVFKIPKKIIPKKVLIVSGGQSGEREVSLSSAKECSKALKSIGHKVANLDYEQLNEFLNIVDSFKPDVIFNALHGNWGESGPFQGILESIKIPYTHSGLLSSALAMNKHLTKNFLRSEGIPTPIGSLITESDLTSRKLLKINYVPSVIKPNMEGSSLGVAILKTRDELENFIKEKKDYYDNHIFPQSYVLEDYIPGRELTTGIVNDMSLGVTEIITEDWYDYRAKYEAKGSKHIVPAEIPQGIYELCKEYAFLTHKLLGCKGISRVDFRWNDALGEDGLFVLEINTQPGLTPTSLMPEQAAAFGISFQELCNWIIEDASCYR